MRKCECCGEREATTITGGTVYGPDAQGLPLAESCWALHGGAGIRDRIRARRAAQSAEPQLQQNYGLQQQLSAQQQQIQSLNAMDLGHAEALGSATLYTPYATVAAPRFCACSKAERPVMATHGEMCVYCDARDHRDDFETQCAMWNPGARAAQSRMDAADKRNAPKHTAESRMLSLGEHYATKVYPVDE